MPQSSSKDLVRHRAEFVDIGENQHGQRIDNFLISRIKGIPKSLVYRIIRKGEVRVNKGRIKQGYRLQVGDVVRIPPLSSLKQNNSSDIDVSKYRFLLECIVFEDDVLLVMNKPSGLAVHSGSGVRHGIIEIMRGLRSDLSYLELVHRLDRDTSGCLVLAKKASALRALQKDFRENSSKNPRVDKRYIALVKGRWRFGERKVTKPLNVDHRKGGERHVVVDEQGSFASSIVSPISTSKFASKVNVKLLTGRTHQVRVHCLSEGHPLAGDKRYGCDDFNRDLKQKGLKRLFLHASTLGFFHPVSGQSIQVEAQLPEDLSSLLRKLELS